MLEVSRLYKEEYKRLNGDEFPQDPRVQLMEAVKAVFRSWNNDRANVYRKMNDIPYSWGTAVNVQEMVYGNLGENSGTGVAFTRNPATGEKVLYGEYLMNAQGEDVVAGVRTPQPIATLEEGMPEVYKQFVETAATLENHYKDMQDMEFTIENGKLFMLQTRNGKRTAAASIKIALDLIDEGMITKEEAVLRVEPGSLDQLLHPMFDAEALKNGKVIARGLAASPGAATGRIYFNAEDASKHTEAGEDTILVRLETSPEDIQGMHDAKGILTIRGGMTSHAAVVARGMGRCCVCGCGELTIDENKKKLVSADGLVLKEGDYVSLNGSTGEVYGEEIKTVEPAITGDFERFMEIVDSVRKLKVYANADTPTDARQAIKFGAEGIGLVRTEHMFFNDDRIFSVRKMITAPNVEKRKEALAELLDMQRGDFEELFRVMEGHPMTIRYLDPPLHEFLPKEEKEIESLAKSLGMSFDELKERIESLKEFNPMMGHRGCRLDITYTEIAEMQTRAVIEAALNVTAEGINVTPEIMIPLVGDVKELHYVKELVDNTAKEVMEEKGKEISYKVGTMIEVPRAALLSGQLAKEAEFFSFGTNDLTQMTFGFSRDDAAKFLNDYYDKKIFEQDPFAKLDETGVGKLMEIAIYQARNVKENIKLGICGEHAGNPASIKFCKQIGLNYVSCSPFRVPVARLAAAQAEIETNDK
jgi:pyruvate,orthophosphate dikinase